MNLPRFSVRNPVAVNLLMWAILIGGAYEMTNLVREFFPNSTPEMIFVTVPYPGATPEEVEKTVTLPIERELRGVENVKEIRSTVFEGVSLTEIELDEGVDYDRVLNAVRGEVDKAQPDLPDGAEQPEIVSVRPFIPVITLAVHGNVDEHRLHDSALDIRDELLELPGISNVALTGIRDREVHVEVAPELLDEHSITLEEVGLALGASNLDLPGGQLKSSVGNMRVRTMGESGRARLIEQLPVRVQPDGTIVRVGDLATVVEDFEDTVERGLFAGEPSVSIVIFKTPEEDAISISEDVRAWVAEHPTFLGGAVRVTTSNNLARFIEQRIDLMTRNGLWGLSLVLLTLAFFLDLRVAGWVAVGLLVSFFGTFIVMDFVGATINLISLFGLIIVLGLIVDDAIVIAESVFTKIRAGLPQENAAVEGTKAVGVPVLAAVLTTMAAFLPLAFLQGRLGTFLQVLPVVVIAALGVSLLEAFLILPLHLAHAARPRRPGSSFLGRAIHRFGELRHRLLEEQFPALYERVLRFVVRWRYVTLAVAVSSLLMAVGLTAGGRVPFVLLEDADAETVVSDLEMASGTSEQVTEATLVRIEGLVRAQPEVQSVSVLHGVSFSDQGREIAPDPAILGQLTVELRPAEDRREEGLRTSRALTADLSRETRDLPGVSKLTFHGRSGGPVGADIEVLLRGDDLDDLAAVRTGVRALLAQYGGVISIEDDLRRGKVEARLTLRDDARPLGLTTRDLALTVRHALFGVEVQELQSKDEAVTVRVLLPEEHRREIADLEQLRIPTRTGGRVPLGEIADLELDRGYATLGRVDGRRSVTVKADVDETTANVAEITRQLAADLDELEARFPGVTWSFEGQKKQTMESLGSLKIGFPVALLLIYCIVAILFRSYLQPFLVMMVIPFSFFGVIVGHMIMGFPITLLSMIGGVALAGIVVNDSLILVNAVNGLRRTGDTSLTEAVIQGARSRLRAVLLTTVTTIAGLAPLMTERSFQARFLIPMAISIVFGLAFATALTLLLLPSFYVMLEDAGKVVRWAFGLPPRSRQAVESGLT